jgi:hypothetical protein
MSQKWQERKLLKPINTLKCKGAMFISLNLFLRGDRREMKREATKENNNSSHGSKKKTHTFQEKKHEERNHV